MKNNREYDPDKTTMESMKLTYGYICPVKYMNKCGCFKVLLEALKIIAILIGILVGVGVLYACVLFQPF